MSTTPSDTTKNAIRTDTEKGGRSPAGGSAAPGTVYLVGAGPGDPDLITVKAMRLLAAADVVLFDRLANPALLKHVRPGAMLIDAGKLPDRHKLTQDQTNALLAEHAMKGAMVVRLKGGDPYVFGRGSEEAMFLAERGIPFEVVPGVTAAIAAPAYAGIPVTHRNVSTTLTLVTGHEDPTKTEKQTDYAPLAALAAVGGTVCFYMGMGRLDEIVSELTRHGLAADTPAAVIEWGTHSHQRSLRSTLARMAADVEAARLSSPAIILVGRVAAVDRKGLLNWFERRPLFGRTVLTTRTRHQASELRERLEGLGASVIEAATIELTAPEDWAAVDASLRRLAEYDWLILTSANGAAAMAERLGALGLDARALTGVRLAAIGDATAEAMRKRLGVRPDLVPTRFVAESLAADLIASESMAGKRVLMLRADIARPALREKLTEAGAKVEDIAVYETRRAAALPEEAMRQLESGKIDWVTFTSSSTATNLVELLGGKRELLESVRIASIGPITSKTLRDLGLAITVEADPHTIGGLVEAMVRAESAR